MGSIFSRHRNASEELELIVSKLDKLHSRTINLQKNRYNFLWWLTVIFLFGSSVYSGIICAKDIQPRFAYVLLTWFIGAVLLFIVRFFSVQLFNFILRRDEQRVQSLNEQRTKIIEHVKENEKFKVAKEIIEKFGGPDDLLEIRASANGDKKANTPPPNSQQPPKKPSLNNSNESTSDRDVPHQDLKTPANTERPFVMAKRQGIGALNQAFVTPAMRRQPVRPYIQPARTPIDKIIDYIIGDGPSNRFALICNECRVHNGMCLREEFNNMSFICFNCGLFNPARKQKNIMPANARPQLCDTPITTPLIRTATNSESSDNESEEANEDTLKQEKSTNSAEKTKSPSK